MSLAISNVAAAIGEVQRNYLYKLVIEEVPSALTTLYPDAQKMGENIDLFATTGVFPTRKTAKIVFNWGGEFIHYSGVDESKKEGELVCVVDSDCKALDFFEACKDLTGNNVNNGAIPRTLSRLRLGVYLIDIDKETIRDYRQLIDVMVLGCEVTDLKKDGKEILTFKVGITWDSSNKDTSKRGTKI